MVEEMKKQQENTELISRLKTFSILKNAMAVFRPA